MNPQPSNDPGALRRAAEERLKERPATRQPQNEADLRKLLHELEVHQIELMMQNEELQAAQADLSAAAERYENLYDFAPVGYFTLTAEGTVQLVNLAGASLLGAESARLLGRRFIRWVAQPDRRAFDTVLARAFATETKQTCEVVLANRGRPPVTVAIEAGLSPDRRECRAVVMDVTARKRAEEALSRQTRELTRFNRAMIGREARMIELKQEVNELCRRLGEPPRHATQLPQGRGVPRANAAVL